MKKLLMQFSENVLSRSQMKQIQGGEVCPPQLYAYCESICAYALYNSNIWEQCMATGPCSNCTKGPDE